MADRPADQELRELTGGWWLVALAGVLGVVVGAVVLAKPGHSLAALAVLSGVFILVESILELLHAALAERSGVAALLGVLGVVVGVLLIRHPLRGAGLVGLVIGLWLIALGIVRLVNELSVARRIWSIAVAGIEVIAGVVIVASPHMRYTTLALAVGVSFVANGLALVVLARLLHIVRVAAPELAPDNHRTTG